MTSRYWTLFTASTISNLGDGVLLAALPLLTASLTRDPAAVALTTAAVWTPWLVFSLPAGVVVDRWDRRRIMVATDLVRVGILLGLVAMIAADATTLPLLYASAFALGTAECFFDNAAQTILPSLVGEEDLGRANGRLFAAEITANQFVGPPIGSAVFLVAASLPFLIDAASFAVSAVLLATLSGRFGSPSPTAQSTMRSEAKAGLRWLWNHKVIRAYAIGAATLNIGFTAGFSILVLYSQDTLQISDAGFGLLLATLAVGSTIGSLTSSRISKRLGQPNAIALSVVVIGSGLIAIGVMGNAIATALLLASIGFGEMVWNVIAVSYRQAEVPDHLLGRVNSVYRLIAFGSFPVGALLGGVTGSVLGLDVVWMIGGGIVLLVAPFMANALRPAE